jgi:hypothetical protein
MASATALSERRCTKVANREIFRLLLAHFGKPGQPQLVIPKISQQTLASIIGSTREVHSSLLTIVLNE